MQSSIFKFRPETSKNTKPLASVSLDLDDQWSYMKSHGDDGWSAYPSYLEFFIPKFTDLLDELNIKITFFIVGQDAARERTKDLLKILTERGHEIANHSFSHEPWIHSYSKEQIKRELLAAHEQILETTGQEPIGFRGPGFTWSSTLLEALAEMNYVYDASTLPTYIGPLARMYYFRTSQLTKKERQQRKGMYSSFRDGMRPVGPYFWQIKNGTRILEIPVTTLPFLKIPFHLSYLLYLCRYSEFFMLGYLRTALFLCQATKTEPSFLLHPLDIIDGSQVPELRFFPGMDMDSDKKKQIFKKVFSELSKHFRLVNMSTHAQSILKQRRIKTVQVSNGEYKAGGIKHSAR